jgi:hypothetical protein
MNMPINNVSQENVDLRVHHVLTTCPAQCLALAIIIIIIIIIIIKWGLDEKETLKGGLRC